MTRRGADACTLMDMDTRQVAPNLVPIAEAATRARRTTKTMRRWIATGRVTPYRDPVSGWLYLDTDEIASLTTPVPESPRSLSA